MGGAFVLPRGGGQWESVRGCILFGRGLNAGPVSRPMVSGLPAYSMSSIFSYAGCKDKENMRDVF